MQHIVKIQALFRNKRQFHLFVLLCLSTLFNFALIGGRLHHLGIDIRMVADTQDFSKLRGSSTFLFLVWNLFLAWIPYLIALSIEGISSMFRSRLIVLLTFASWLFFFPNAPYILTDLLHLKNRAPVPHWYDLMLIASFAWTGLMLGLLSLYEIQVFLKKRYSLFFSRSIICLSILACSYGVYLGRYLRWNTWDILTNPFALFNDIIQTFIHPDLYKATFSVSIVMSVFLLLAYLMLTALIGEGQRQATQNSQ